MLIQHKVNALHFHALSSKWIQQGSTKSLSTSICSQANTFRVFTSKYIPTNELHLDVVCMESLILHYFDWFYFTFYNSLFILCVILLVSIRPCVIWLPSFESIPKDLVVIIDWSCHYICLERGAKCWLQLGNVECFIVQSIMLELPSMENS